MTPLAVNKELSLKFYHNGWKLMEHESNSSVWHYVGKGFELKCFVLVEHYSSKVCHILNNDVAISRQFNQNPGGIWDIEETMSLFTNPNLHDKQVRVGFDYQPKWYKTRERKCQKCGEKAVETIEYCQPCINEIKNSLLGK